MTRKKTTHEAIFSAVERLKANGRTPTLAAIRLEIGGGSFTTISEALKELKRRQFHDSAPSPPLPKELEEHLLDLGQKFWALASKTTQAQSLEAIRRFKEERDQFEADMKEAMAAADTLAIEMDRLKILVGELEFAAKRYEEEKLYFYKDKNVFSAERDEMRAQIRQLTTQLAAASDLNKTLSTAIAQNQTKETKTSS